jgi:hypothetical protein
VSIHPPSTKGIVVLSSFLGCIDIGCLLMQSNCHGQRATALPLGRVHPFLNLMYGSEGIAKENEFSSIKS